MNFEQSDLFYGDYSWQEKEVPSQVTTFDQTDGQNVLSLINHMTMNFFDGQILELIIHDFLPATIQSLQNAMNWITEKGDYYYKQIVRFLAKED